MKAPKATLAQQCEGIGWSITDLVAHKHDKRSWSINGGAAGLPEEVVGQTYATGGARVSYCEGGSVLLLLKAAALETLARLNTFNDRDDAIVRFLEAQMTILAGHTDEIVDTVRSITPDGVARNVRELAANARLSTFFPRVRADFMLDLYQQMGNEMLAKILEAFSAAPYDYRAGWPDLIVLGDDAIKFVEVKTNDRLLDTQIRFATGIGNPMGFDCGVVRLTAIKGA
ncbi:VRR-NUC domain-containing protein [Pseudomonas putida]|uniref:VRR-NUC domain-containing protein n=1 Tax=Pseudomonas putida TaxID=303 RepID=UPI000DB06F10|nr:VRR-NUC domain-containing protein [Pseudomonas putida]MBI6943821.1 VRR-NUC domain-containing protein [Pseudomonas putida]MBI6959907.1 VRR-NUC domain-containing protein [Pseudomonas putida]PZQ41203.1 MAG: hypothetical protein DI560_07245 [Pseudomonas putida]